MGGKSSQSTQTVSIPPQVLAQYQAVTARSNQIDQTPFQQYGGEFVSPLTSTQNAGIANTNAAAGQAQPYYGAATGYTLAGGQNVDAQQIGGQQIGQFMSPYLSDVVGSEAALLNQNNQQAMSGQLGNAIQQGAFGGDRAGIAAANLNQQQNLANAQIYSGLLNQGFNTALGAAQQQQGVNLSAEQANRQALQQTGQSLAGLGAGAQTAALQGAQAQMAAGQVQQQTQQAQDTALYNQFQQQQSLPYQQLQQQANIAEGIGANSGSTTTGSSVISDRRAKHDVHEIGKTFDGQPIYSYKYNGDDTTQIGLMAQDVEKKHPGAVGLAGGFKNVDYAKATAGAARRGHFADGGGIDVPDTPPALPGPQDDKQKGPAGSASGSSVPSWLQDAVAATQVTANINNSFPDPFARGGTAGNSEGGVVHEGHFGEGYAGGGLIGGYGESPFIGYDPTAAYQAMYGGLLSPHGTGVTGGAGINIPSSGGSGGTLNAPKLSMETPDPLKGVSQVVGIANGIGQMGNAAHLFPYGNKEQTSWHKDAPAAKAPPPSVDAPGMAPAAGASDSLNGILANRISTDDGPSAAPTPVKLDGVSTDPYVSDLLQNASPSWRGGPRGHAQGGLAAGRYHRDIGGSLPYSEASGGVDVPNDQSTAKLQTSQLKTPNMPDTGKEAGAAMKGIGSILDLIPGMQPIGMGLQAAGTVSSAFARGGAPSGEDDQDPMPYNNETGEFEEGDPILRLALRKMKGEPDDDQDDSAPAPDDHAPQGLAAGAPKAAAPAPAGLAAAAPSAAPEDSGDVADRIRRVEGLGHNPLSSAQGAFQMLRGTFINQFRKAFPQRAAGMSDGDIAALRNSPEASQLNESLGRHLVSEEGNYLRQKGLGADAGNVYLAHFMGPAGATTLLRANPSDPVANHVDSGVIKANPFLAHMSVGDVINWTHKKMQPVARASGGLVGRKGYSGEDGDSAVFSTMAGDDDSYDDGRTPQYNAGYNEAMMARGQDNSGQTGSGQSFDLLRGPKNYIGDLGKGDANAWLPLLAGVGAAFSGPYRGLVGLGRGVAAAAQEGEAARQFGLKQRQVGYEGQHVQNEAMNVQNARAKFLADQIQRTQLGAYSQNPIYGARAQQDLEAQRAELRAIVANAGTAIAQDPDVVRALSTDTSREPTGVAGEQDGATPATGVAAGATAQQPYTAANMTMPEFMAFRAHPTFGNLLQARNAAMFAATHGFPGEAEQYQGVINSRIPEDRYLDDNGILQPKSSLATSASPTAPAPIQEPGGAPAAPSVMDRPPVHRHGNAPAAPAGRALSREAPEDQYGQSHYIPHLPQTASLDDNYNPDKLTAQLASSRNPGGIDPQSPRGQQIMNLAQSIQLGAITPHDVTGAPNEQWRRYFEQKRTMEANASHSQDVVRGYRPVAANASTVLDNTRRDTQLLLDAARTANISGTGTIPGAVSAELQRLGVGDGTSFSARDIGQYVNKSGEDIRNILRTAGIDTPVSVTPGSAAATLYDGAMLRRAAAKMVFDKGADFRKADEALKAKGDPFTDIDRFNGNWNGSHNIRDYVGTEVHQNGFIAGMNNADKMRYAQYLPEISQDKNHVAIDPRQKGGAEKGYYRLNGKIVKVENGRVVGTVAY